MLPQKEIIENVEILLKENKYSRENINILKTKEGINIWINPKVLNVWYLLNLSTFWVQLSEVPQKEVNHLNKILDLLQFLKSNYHWECYSKNDIDKKGIYLVERK